MQISQEALVATKKLIYSKKLNFFISQYQRQLIDLMHFSVSIDVHRILKHDRDFFLMASIFFIEFGIAQGRNSYHLTVFAFAALRLLPLFLHWRRLLFNYDRVAIV